MGCSKSTEKKQPVENVELIIEPIQCDPETKRELCETPLERKLYVPKDICKLSMIVRINEKTQAINRSNFITDEEYYEELDKYYDTFDDDLLEYLDLDVLYFKEISENTHEKNEQIVDHIKKTVMLRSPEPVVAFKKNPQKYKSGILRIFNHILQMDYSAKNINVYFDTFRINVDLRIADSINSRGAMIYENDAIIGCLIPKQGRIVVYFVDDFEHIKDIVINYKNHFVATQCLLCGEALEKSQYIGKRCIDNVDEKFINEYVNMEH